MSGVATREEEETRSRAGRGRVGRSMIVEHVTASGTRMRQRSRTEAGKHSAAGGGVRGATTGTTTQPEAAPRHDRRITPGRHRGPCTTQPAGHAAGRDALMGRHEGVEDRTIIEQREDEESERMQRRHHGYRDQS